MDRCQRVIETLNHHQPDAIPVDVGATAVTGMHCSCVAALRYYYGLEQHLVKVHEPYQMLGLIEEDLKQAIGVDVDGIAPRNTLSGFANTQWQSWRTQWNQEVLVSEHFKTATDAHGDVFIYPQGDTNVPPCARMPGSGFVFDAIIRQEPIDDAKLNIARISQMASTFLCSARRVSPVEYGELLR